MSKITRTQVQGETAFVYLVSLRLPQPHPVV